MRYRRKEFTHSVERIVTRSTTREFIKFHEEYEWKRNLGNSKPEITRIYVDWMESIFFLEYMAVSVPSRTLMGL